MQTQKIVGKVSHEGESYLYSAILHETSSRTELQLSPEGFYEKFGGKIPEGTHYEMQWEVLPIASAEVDNSLTHVHVGPENELFVCWTKQVDNIDDARKIVEMCALGITYACIHRKDFAEIFKESNGSSDETIKAFENKHDLHFLSFDNSATQDALIKHALIAEKVRMQ